MSNETKSKVVPKLRFPEFKDSGEWEFDTFDSLMEVVDGDRGINYPKAEEFSLSGYCVFLNAKNVTKNGFAFDEIQFITQEKDEALRKGKLRRLDLVLTTRGSVGQFAFYTEKVPYHQIRINSGMVILRVNPNLINPNYLYEFCKSQNITSAIKNLAFGNAQQQLTVAVIKKLPLLYPKIKEEQQKIADCLSSLDELITAQTQKLQTLKVYKKGLMQQLFPAEGETVPKLRFAEFKDSGEWEEYSIDELILENIIFAPKDGNHGNIHPKSSDYVRKGIPFIMASDLQSGKIDFSKCAYLRKEQADSLQKGFAKEGDVLLSHKGTVGEVVLLKKMEFPYVMLTPQVTYYRVKDKSKLSNEFLAAYFTYDSFQEKLKVAAGGGTRAYIGILEQGKLKLIIPANILEQQKIADCLSSLDEQISAQTEKIEVLKTHKKGLMQALFPSPEVGVLDEQRAQPVAVKAITS